MKSILSLTMASMVFATSAQSAIVYFDLLGKAGAGLLAGNENSAVSGTPGTGGETGIGINGISYDDVTNILTVKVAWGSLNGFTDLTSVVSGAHIHGTAASSAPASFLLSTPVLFHLTRVSDTANGGSVNTTVVLSELQEADLIDGKYYINIHTGTNGGGEIRGNIVIPEPSQAILGLAGLGLMAFRRRR